MRARSVSNGKESELMQGEFSLCHSLVHAHNQGGKARPGRGIRVWGLAIQMANGQRKKNKTLNINFKTHLRGNFAAITLRRSNVSSLKISQTGNHVPREQ